MACFIAWKCIRNRNLRCWHHLDSSSMEFDTFPWEATSKIIYSDNPLTTEHLNKNQQFDKLTNNSCYQREIKYIKRHGDTIQKQNSKQKIVTFFNWKSNYFTKLTKRKKKTETIKKTKPKPKKKPGFVF